MKASELTPGRRYIVEGRGIATLVSVNSYKAKAIIRLPSGQTVSVGLYKITAELDAGTNAEEK